MGVFTSNNASKAEVYTIVFAKTSKEEGVLTCITFTVGLVCFAERIGGKLGTFAVVKLVANLSYAKAFCICARANSRHQFLTWTRRSEAVGSGESFLPAKLPSIQFLSLLILHSWSQGCRSLSQKS